MQAPAPEHIDLKQDEALTIRWTDGSESVYPVAYLRRMSPAARRAARCCEQWMRSWWVATRCG